MAQPRQPKHNKPNRSEGIGFGSVEVRGWEEGGGEGGYGGEGKERETHDTPPPPPAEAAAGAERAIRPEKGEVAPPPLGGRGTPEEQAWAIVARLIIETPGGGQPSGQTPALPSQQPQSQGARGRERGHPPSSMRSQRTACMACPPPLNTTNNQRGPPEQCAHQAQGVQKGGWGEWGRTPARRGGGPPP